MDKSAHATFLQEVRSDIAELERQIQSLRAVEAYHSEKCGKPAHLNGHAPVAETSPKGQVSLEGLGQRTAAIIVMKEMGKPMRTGDIAREMMKRGFDYADAAKLSNALFTSFARGPQLFRKVSSGLWDLIEPPEADSD